LESIQAQLPDDFQAWPSGVDVVKPGHLWLACNSLAALRRKAQGHPAAAAQAANRLCAPQLEL